GDADLTTEAVNRGVMFVVLWTIGIVLVQRRRSASAAQATEERAAADRVRLTAELSETVDRLTLILSSVPLGVAIVDPERRFTYVNPAAERLFGWTSSELIGNEPFGLMTPMSLRPTDDAFHRVPRANVLGDGAVLENYTKDGRALRCSWLHVPLHNPDGAYIGTIAMVQDITGRWASQEALRESEERYRSITENAPEAILVFDADARRFVDANPVALRLLQLDRDRLGAYDTSIVVPDTQPDGRQSSALGEAYI